jgi:hypothetical protein
MKIRRTVLGRLLVHVLALLAQCALAGGPALTGR